MKDMQTLQRGDGKEKPGKVTKLTITERSKAALEAFGYTNNALTAFNTFIFPNSWTHNGGVWNGGGGADWGGTGWLSLAPRDFKYQNINTYNSSIVMACLNWIVSAYKEATPRVYKQTNEGNTNFLPNHRLQRLIDRPNPFYTYSKMIEATLISYYLDGNAYWFKERGDGGAGLTRALYYVPHWQIIPYSLNGQYISYYQYNVNGQTYTIDPSRIVHFKNGLDPYNVLSGRKILNPTLSEIYTDEECADFAAALVKNTAIPGVIIQPDTDKVNVEEEDAEALKESFKRKFGGDNRGEPLITNFAAKVTQVGFSPEQLQFKEIRRLPEERVAAQFGLPPVVAGLGAGLDQSTYANFAEAEQHAYRSVLIPRWKDIAEDINLQLAPEITGGDDSINIEYDYSDVNALQESQDSIVNRAVKLFAVDGIMRSELREQTGFTVEEARDSIFLSEIRQAAAAARAALNPQTPPTNTPTPPPTKKRIEDAQYLLKALPPGDYDNAFEMTQEATLKDAIGDMQGDLDDMFFDLGKQAEKEARETLDKNNPEDESKRIMHNILKAVGLYLLLKAIWGLMGKNVEEATVDSITLRLGMGKTEVWDDSAASNAKSVLLRFSNEYGNDLTEQTRKAIEEAIRGAQDGDSVITIAKNIRSNVEGKTQFPGIYKEGYDEAIAAGAKPDEARRKGEAKARNYRAKQIAQTETRSYQNSVVLESLAKIGAEEVLVKDGDGCGWTKHDSKDKANNTIRPISEARKYVLIHPNCQRRFFPVDNQEDAG